MSDWLMLYLITRLDYFHSAVVVLIFVAIFFFVVGLIAYLTSHHPDTDGYHSEQHKIKVEQDRVNRPLYRKTIKASMVSLAVLYAVRVLVPTQTDMAIIIGGSFALEATRSPEAKELVGAVRAAVMKQLKEASR